MTTSAAGSYQVSNWDEKPLDEQKYAVKLTNAHVTNTFSGDIEGEGSAEYLLAYPSEQYATFVGFQQVTGSAGGRKGSLMLQVSGTFEGGMARAEWFVVPGSGAGDLKGLTGRGGYESSGPSADWTLQFDFG